MTPGLTRPMDPSTNPGLPTGYSNHYATVSSNPALRPIHSGPGVHVLTSGTGGEFFLPNQYIHCGILNTSDWLAG
jgi:hypothetical protein